MWHQIEAFLVQVLLRSPKFHQGVGFVHKNIHRLKHGKPPDEMGGTNIGSPQDKSSLIGHFLDEVRNQMGGKGPPRR